MDRKAQKGLHGVKATIFTCPKCYYHYEKGIRYNRAQNSITFSLDIEGLSRQNSSNFNGFLQSTQYLICMNYVDIMIHLFIRENQFSEYIINSISFIKNKKTL